MKITRWNQTQSYLSFTINTNHVHYPTCLLNGNLPDSKIYDNSNGEYSFNMQPEKYYYLVCSIQYETKEYIIEDTFFSSNDSNRVTLEASYFAYNKNHNARFIVLGSIVIIIFLLICYIIKNINRFKGYTILDGSNTLASENERLKHDAIIHNIGVTVSTQSQCVIPLVENEWRCQSCMYYNSTSNKYCEMCHSLNPDYLDKETKDTL